MTDTAPTEGKSKSRKPLRIALVVGSLEGGGTERQIVLLATKLRSRGHDIRIIVKKSGGRFFEEAARSGIPLFATTGSLIGRAVQIRRTVHAEKIDVVYGFLPESNIVLSLAKLLKCRATVIHGVRSSKFDLAPFSLRTRLAYRISFFSTILADGVIFNSRAGAESYRIISRLARNQRVIPNGFDTIRFSPRVEAANALRIRHQIKLREPIAAFVGRVDPLKGIDTLLTAMTMLNKRDKLPHFLIVGSKNEAELDFLRKRISEMGLDERVRVEGFTRCPEDIFRAVDLVVLPSRSEGFPNVLVEALLCGAQVVATDVGDVGWIMGEEISLAEPDDADSLATHIEEALANPVNPALRTRVAERFSDSEMVRATEDFFYCLRHGGERRPNDSRD